MNASPKVLEVFSQTFKDPRDVKWFSNGDKSTAVFVDNDIRTIITYDKNANFLLQGDIMGDSNLSFNILLKIKEKYKAKKLELLLK